MRQELSKLNIFTFNKTLNAMTENRNQVPHKTYCHRYV